MILLIQSTSIKCFNSIKDDLQGCNIFTYHSGQDFQSLADDFCKDAKELLATGQYEYSSTLIMLKVFLKTGGTKDDADDYCYSPQNKISVEQLFT
jgi:hypothetical protein